MHGLARVVVVVGWVLLWAGGAVLLIALISTWYYFGFSKVQETMNPLNIYQWIFTCLVLAPGFLLIQLGEWLRRRAALRKTP